VLWKCGYKKNHVIFFLVSPWHVEEGWLFTCSSSGKVKIWILVIRYYSTWATKNGMEWNRMNARIWLECHTLRCTVVYCIVLYSIVLKQQGNDSVLGHMRLAFIGFWFIYLMVLYGTVRYCIILCMHDEPSKYCGWTANSLYDYSRSRWVSSIWRSIYTYIYIYAYIPVLMICSVL
jgi:hypothetical protein